MNIAIIGSGVAGLACARRLNDAGLTPVIFDKGRGIGGRVATRRAEDGLQFDHGAQMIQHCTAAFQEVLAQAQSDGFVAEWHDDQSPSAYVGTPGMTGFAKYLGQGLDLHQATEITALTREAGGWSLHADTPLGLFDRVVCTAPAPQTAILTAGALTQSLDAVTYDPGLTLMVALTRTIDAPVTQTNPTDAFAWIARDSAKPGRPMQTCWVVQASADWSAAHLEMSKDEIAALMLALFLDLYNLHASEVAYATAHRWRYALVTKPLGQSFVTSLDGGLYACGDWCLGPRIEHAWQSGTATADDILRSV